MKPILRRQLLVSALALAVAGCATGPQLASGEVVIRERLLVTTDKPWNQFPDGLPGQLHPLWTQDGVSLDTVNFYVGLKDGQLLAPTPTPAAGNIPLAFKSGMSAADALKLFEALYSRGGSTFTMQKVTPATFAGSPGLRFEWELLRRQDDARLNGVGWVTVRNGELFAMTYTAPRLHFFARHLASAEALARTARIR
jgi:hypothetical protein